MGGDLLQAALENARRGFRVFPCKAGQKTPAVKAFYDWATTDEEKLIAWWTAHPEDNPAVSTDDLVVVDIDVKSGKDGLESFKKLNLPASFAVATPSGGFHVYYRGECKNSAGGIAPGIDIRGHHGYVLAAGAKVAAGGYRVRSESGVRPAPDSLKALLPVPTAKRVNGVDVRIDGAAGATDRAAAYLVDEAPVAVEGSSGDETTYKVAARLKDMGVNEFDAWDLMAEHWNDRCSPPWSPEGLERKVRNAYQYGARPPGVDAPEVIFDGVTPPMPERSGMHWGYHGDPPEVENQWLFYKILPSQGTLLVVGQTQSGKTFLLTELARCVATGKSWFGVPPDEKGAVLCLFAGTEGSGIANRLAALGEDAKRLPIAYAHIPNLRQTGALEQLTKDAKEQAAFMLERFKVPVRLVILETVSASGLVDKENDASDVAAAVRTVGIIGKEIGALFATSHHPSKNGVQARGSGAWTANVDCEIQISRDGSSPVRIVDLTKARNAAQRVLGSFSLEEVEVGADARGRPVTSMGVTMSADLSGVRRARKSQFVETLAQALDQVPGEAMIDVLGRPGVEKRSLRKIFYELKPGDKNMSNMRKAFDAALHYAEQNGMVDTVAHLGTTYVVRRDYT